MGNKTTRPPTAMYSVINSGDSYVEPKASKKRFLVLFSFILLSLLNNFTQYSFSPITEDVARFYNVSEMEVDWLAMVYMIAGFTTRFVGMWVLDYFGLGPGTYIAAALNCLGGALRVWPGATADGYYYLLAGQCICAVSQSFIDISGPKLAANWFPPKERTTATALASGPLFLSVLLAYAAAPRIVHKGSRNHPFKFTWTLPLSIPEYIALQGVLILVATVFIALFFRGSPPTPPSYSAAAEKTPLWNGVKSLFKNKNFLLLCVVYSITLGFAVALSVLMDEIVGPVGFDQSSSGILGAIWVSCAIIGGFAGGPIIDRTRQYKKMMVIMTFLMSFSLLAFSLFLKFLPNFYVLCVCMGFMGLAASGVPAMLEAGIETTYPLPEATAMGMLFFGLNISALSITFGMERLENAVTHDMFVSLWCAVGLTMFSACLTFFFNEDYKRLKFEADRERHHSVR